MQSGTVGKKDDENKALSEIYKSMFQSDPREIECAGGCDVDDKHESWIPFQLTYPAQRTNDRKDEINLRYV